MAGLELVQDYISSYCDWRWNTQQLNKTLLTRLGYLRSPLLSFNIWRWKQHWTPLLPAAESLIDFHNKLFYKFQKSKWRYPDIYRLLLWWSYVITCSCLNSPAQLLVYMCKYVRGNPGDTHQAVLTKGTESSLRCLILWSSLQKHKYFCWNISSSIQKNKNKIKIKKTQKEEKPYVF